MRLRVGKGLVFGFLLSAATGLLRLAGKSRVGVWIGAGRSVLIDPLTVSQPYPEPPQNFNFRLIRFQSAPGCRSRAGW
jgi:hypothetical protein